MIDEDLRPLRIAAKRKLETKIIDAFDTYDVKNILESIEERMMGDAADIADKLMGIDRRWSELDIKEGRLRAIIEPAVDRALKEVAEPLILAELARVIELKTIQAAIKKAVKQRVTDAIYSIECYSSSETAKKIDSLVQAEISEVFKEYTSPSAKD